MRSILIFLLAGAATPALAQHSGHAAPAAPAPSTSCTPEHAAMGHCKLPTPAPQPPPAPPASSATCTPEHAAMGHCKPATPASQTAPAAPATDPACPPEHAAMGHCTPAAPPRPQTGATDPHAGHDMGLMAPPEVPVGPPPPEALSGPRHAADVHYGADQQRGRNVLRDEHGGLPAYKLFIDRAETRVRDGRDGYLIDAQGWYGGDIDKLWLKTEIESDWGEKLEHAEVQALWSHAIAPWFDLQAGARFDPQPGPNRTHLVFGVQGLAPYWWEVEGALFLSNKGDVTARAEAEYDLRITQKLILQPRAEIDLSLQDVPELAIGSGLTNSSLGLRLRYQISPLVAPYIGVEYERAFGDTRRFLRAEGEDPGGFNLLAGVRFWF
jgi:copper resistance protein B